LISISIFIFGSKKSSISKQDQLENSSNEPNEKHKSPYKEEHSIIDNCTQDKDGKINFNDKVIIAYRI
jgi:hypothetical protein